MSKTIKPKLSLNPSPTFTSAVDIPTRGGKVAEIVVTYKHRTRDQLKEFMDSLKPAPVEEGEVAQPGPTDTEILMDIASGWDLDEPFDKENIDKLVQNHIGAPLAILHNYYAELSGAARAKNS